MEGLSCAHPKFGFTSASDYLTDGLSTRIRPQIGTALRAGYAVVGGSQEHHPEGIYYLRYLRDGKRSWQAVGPKADTAIVALRNTEHDLNAIGLGISTPKNATVVANASGVPNSISLADAIVTYLEELRQHKAPLRPTVWSLRRRACPRAFSEGRGWFKPAQNGSGLVGSLQSDPRGHRTGH